MCLILYDPDAKTSSLKCSFMSSYPKIKSKVLVREKLSFVPVRAPLWRFTANPYLVMQYVWLDLSL